jgi:adenine/guanine phosphoribosyltransferase-like PRPP-binding protein
VLGKHVPADPRTIRGVGRLLGVLVARQLGATVDDEALVAAAAELRHGASDVLDGILAELSTEQPAAVFGFAETATGLGHCVAEALSASWYLHSTRRPVDGVPVSARFEEGHSHATSHLVLPQPPSLLTGDEVLVLVDDEFSTGATAIGTIAALHALQPRERYVIAALIDLRSPADVRAMAEFAASLSCEIGVVALVSGSVTLPAELTTAVAAHIGPRPEPSPTDDTATHTRVDVSWPAAVPDGGRHGFLNTDFAAFEEAAAAAADAVLAALPAGAERILVVGTEEFMYLPLRLAGRIADTPGYQARFQTTTRSPVHPENAPDYPVRRGFTFDGPEDGGERYLYNADWRTPDGRPLPGAQPDAVVIVVDAAQDRSALVAGRGLVAALHRLDVPIVLTVVSGCSPTAFERDPMTTLRHPLPQPLTGPNFGSYKADEVSWLLKDLSHVELEAGVAVRERRIQSGQAHYAESLPIEFQPDASYQNLFSAVLIDTAGRLARAVGLVTGLILAERGDDVVLVSLARAGTPVGILLKRWARAIHGVELPHYAVSIVRGRGIDRVALEYLAVHHNPASIVFVDGWTGKGAIALELHAALADVARGGGPQFDSSLAVLADPGSCVTRFGTRDDFLIASACLNSTVSGLVSRTVLNDNYIGPNDFHGAKFYAELAGVDRSAELLDTVTDQFGAVAAEVAAELPALLAGNRTPAWSGWSAVEKIRSAYGLSSVNFVKPGVGETTRVLLRRAPSRVLVRELDNPDHAHIRMLAALRGVPVEVVPDLAYACVGLIEQLSGAAADDDVSTGLPPQ